MWWEPIGTAMHSKAVTTGSAKPQQCKPSNSIPGSADLLGGRPTSRLPSDWRRTVPLALGHLLRQTHLVHHHQHQLPPAQHSWTWISGWPELVLAHKAGRLLPASAGWRHVTGISYMAAQSTSGSWLCPAPRSRLPMVTDERLHVANLCCCILASAHGIEPCRVTSLSPHAPMFEHSAGRAALPPGSRLLLLAASKGETQAG